MKQYKPSVELKKAVEYVSVYESGGHYDQGIDCSEYGLRDTAGEIKPLITVDHKVGDLIEHDGDTYKIVKVANVNHGFSNSLNLLSFHLVKI